MDGNGGGNGLHGTQVRLQAEVAVVERNVADWEAATTALNAQTDLQAREASSLDAKLRAIPPLVKETADRLRDELMAVHTEHLHAERALWQKRASAVESKVSALKEKLRDKANTTMEPVVRRLAAVEGALVGLEGAEGRGGGRLGAAELAIHRLTVQAEQESTMTDRRCVQMVELLRAEVGQYQVDVGGAKRQWEDCLGTLKALCVELSQRLATAEGGVQRCAKSLEAHREDIHQQVRGTHLLVLWFEASRVSTHRILLPTRPARLRR
jgi:chromosome segregation ATPase